MPTERYAGKICRRIAGFNFGCVQAVLGLIMLGYYVEAGLGLGIAATVRTESEV